jgi:hypothetical protein
MTKNLTKQRKSINEKLARILANLFDNVELEIPDEINAVLREAGYDPDEIGARMKSAAEQVLIDSSFYGKPICRTLVAEREKAVDWLRHEYKGEFSELGKNVAWLLDKMWGLHNLNSTSRRKVDWWNDTWIELVIDKILSTIDNDDLTRLVVIAHQLMLRVEMKGVGPGYIRLMFHQRTSRQRGNGFYRWCPDIQEHVEMIIRYHPAIDRDPAVPAQMKDRES